jgi:hypothetical protein
MPQLTQAQRASRRAKKKNNRVIAELPLYADELRPGGTMEGWLTTPEDELVAVERNDERVKKYIEHLRAAEAERKQEEARLRACAIEGKSEEDIAFMDKCRTVYPDSGGYGITFWKKVLAVPNFCEVERERRAELVRKMEAVRDRLNNMTRQT